MNDIVRSFIKIAVIFVIAAVVINDIGAYLYSMYIGNETAKEVAQAFAAEYKNSGSTGSAIEKAQNTALAAETRLTNYTLQDTRVETTIELNIEKTVIINRVDALKGFSKIKVSATAELL